MRSIIGRKTISKFRTMAEFFPAVNTELPVLVLGTAGMDVVGQLDSDLKFATSNPAQIRRSRGGVARNVAENLGQTADAGVDISAVRRTADYPTGFYLGVVDKTGTLQLAIDDMRLMEAITLDYLQEQKALFKSSSLVFLDTNLPVKTIRAAVSLARRAKIPVCADPTSSILAERLKPFLPKLFLITPNFKEASVLTGNSFEASERKAALDAARGLVNQVVRIALVALAEFGVVYATPETTGHIPAIRTRITDPTGAGDAMTAAVMYALLNAYNLDDAVRLGVSAASMTLRQPDSVNPGLSLESLYN